MNVINSNSIEPKQFAYSDFTISNDFDKPFLDVQEGTNVHKLQKSNEQIIKLK